MQDHEHSWPTIGVVAGWQAYEKAILLNYVGPLLRGIRSAARDRSCNLLLACGMRLSPAPVDNRPAWPVPSHTYPSCLIFAIPQNPLEPVVFLLRILRMS